MDFFQKKVYVDSVFLGPYLHHAWTFALLKNSSASGDQLLSNEL